VESSRKLKAMVARALERELEGQEMVVVMVVVLVVVLLLLREQYADTDIGAGHGSP
jgi:hypothetical protein